LAKKQLVYGLEAQQHLLAGMRTLAGAVRATLGPTGMSVALQGTLPRVIVTRDGSATAREIELAARYANMGARLLRETATKTKDVAGDGATSAILLTLGLVNDGLRLVAAGANPMLLKRGLERASAMAVQAIRAMSVKIDAASDLAQVIHTATGDGEIAQFISQVVANVTSDGVVTVEESRRIGLQVEYANGYTFDRGYGSAHFATNPATGEAVVFNPQILVTSHRIKSADDIMPVLRHLAAAGKRNLVIIAEEVSGHALTILVVNKQQEKLKCLAVKAPEFGEQYLPTLEDLAVATGAKLISAEQGHEFRRTTLQDLGGASKVIATRNSTLIINPGGDPAAVAARAEQIRSERRRATDLYQKHRLEQRLARLIGQMAVVRVGAYTPTLLREKKRMLQDAIAAAKVALETGVVPGGGLAFLNAATMLDSLPCATDEETAGVRLLQRSLQEPLRCIAENAGQDGGVVVAQVRRLQEEQDNLYIGYDALGNEHCNLMGKGIVDTARMAYTVIENAASVAGLVLTLESLITPVGDEPPARRSTYRNRI
jgi:chaperonin GroEL